MKCLRLVWPVLLFALAHCASPAAPCPAPQLLVNGICVDLCKDFSCDDENDCTFEECVVDQQALTASCVEADAEDGRVCDTLEAAPGFCIGGRCVGACNPPDCDDGNACTIDGTCNTVTGECDGGRNAPEDTECNGADVCDGAGSCVECNRSQQCDDDNGCTQDSCSGGSCGHENIVGRACDYMGGSQNGICDAMGQCGEPPPNCDPNPCMDTGTDCTEQVCDPEDGMCPVRNLGDGVACSDAPGGLPGECSSGVCVGLCEGKQCPPPPMCLMEAMCNPQTGACDDGDPVPDDPETACDSGTLAGACLGGMCVPIAPDDAVDPVDPIDIDFGDSTVFRTNRVSYPLGDTTDNVSYRIHATGSGGFFGRLTIIVTCDVDPGANVEVFAFGNETFCNAPNAVNRIVTDVSGNTGFVRIEAVGGEGTFVEWTLEMKTCVDTGDQCIF